MSLRSAGKEGFEALASRLLARPGRMAGRGLVLAYHNVVPDETPDCGDRSLHLRMGAFIGQLELIEQFARVIPLADLLGGGHDPHRPSVAITFDDAYLGAVALGLPELARRGLPSTVFVVPGLLEAPSFWWDELAAGGLLTPAQRARALDEFGGRAEQVRAQMSPAERSGGLPKWLGCASLDDLRTAGRSGFVAYGSHTWSHPNLARLPDSELGRELVEPRDWLKGSGLPSVNILSYPYGLTSAAVQTATDAAGYEAAVRIDGGWIPAASAPRLAVPRLNVSAGLSRNGFLLRLSGLLAR